MGLGIHLRYCHLVAVLFVRDYFIDGIDVWSSTMERNSSHL